MPRLTASMAYVLMLAQDGGSLYTATKTPNERNGRRMTIGALRLRGFITDADELTDAGKAALRTYCDRSNTGKAPPAPPITIPKDGRKSCDCQYC